jgi:predicted transcriptional regulator
LSTGGFLMINDRRLIQLIDREGRTQSEAARILKVSRQAVSKRLQELRGKTTKVVAAKKIEQVIDQRLDAVAQLQKINDHANWLLDNVIRWIQGDEAAIQVLEKNARQVNVGTRENPEWVTEYKFKDPHEIALKAMAEIRGQLKLQLEIFQALYDLQAAAEFQEEVLTAIGEVDPDVRTKIICRLNQKRAIRSAVRWS